MMHIAWDKRGLKMKVLTGKYNKGLSLKKQDTITLMVGIVGIFLGRVAIFGTLNPIAIAFLANYILRGYRLYFASVFVIIGLISRFGGAYFIKYFFSVIIIMCVHFALNTLNIRSSKLLKATIAAVSLLIPGLIVTVFLGRGAFYVGTNILESILGFGLVFIIDKGIRVLEGSRHTLNTESLLSAAIILGSVVAGAADIYIATISLKHFISALVVLIVASKGGMATGATCGVMLGLILTITNSSNPYFIGILSVAGMIAGIGKNVLTVIGGFAMAWILMAFYLEPNQIGISSVISLSLASAVFAFGPKNSITLGESDTWSKEYLLKTRDYMTKRLQKFSMSFIKLSLLFTNSPKKHVLTQEDFSILTDKVANTICISCKKRDQCWGTEFYGTYQSFFTLISGHEKRGALSNVTQKIKEFCIRPEKLLDSINYNFELHKNNLNWHNRVDETRYLLRQQLSGIGDIFNNIAADLNKELTFRPHLEGRIFGELIKNKVEVESVIVLENSYGKYEIDIKYKGHRNLIKLIIEVASKISGRKMVEETQQNSGNLYLVEEQNFMVTTGLARAPKIEGGQSGDSYTAMHISGKKCLLMLSDGMGSGTRAREESATTVEIFEDFIETGFDKETAVKIINSVLVLKNEEDYFATLDVCLLDLYTGIGEFIKMGASSTYLMRENRVQVIKNSTLPMGILNDATVDSTKKRLKHGDILVMVTDGIVEPNHPEDKEKYLISLLESTKLHNPQDIADHILNNARDEDKQIRDDMTVMVAKVLEKN